MNCFTDNTPGISEREGNRRTKTNTIGTQIHFGAWFVDVSFTDVAIKYRTLEAMTASVLYTHFTSLLTFGLVLIMKFSGSRRSDHVGAQPNPRGPETKPI